jgi:hypothetical protein
MEMKREIVTYDNVGFCCSISVLHPLKTCVI